MLADGKKLLAYSFSGYWKDVGTIESLWEANMDLIKENCRLELEDDKLRVYARNYDSPPTFISENAICEESLITKGCEIEGEITIS